MHHDCVVVPGFGAFMINHEAARYDASAGIFLPPSRSLGFNPEVRHNDALLLGSISRREGISIEAARSALDNGLASLLHQMRMSGEVHIGRLGVFRQDSNTDLPVFEPAMDSLPLRALDGLQPLAINRLGFNDDEEEKVARADRQPVVIPFPLKIVASIVAVMVGLGILYSTTSLVNGPRVNFASLDTGISTHIEFVTADRVRTAVDVSRGGFVSGLIKRFYANSEFFISTILVGNNVVLVIYGMGAAKMLEPWLEGYLHSEFLVLVAQTFISTAVILLAGEFLPKTVFGINPNSTLRVITLPMALFYVVLYPVSLIATFLSRMLMRLVGAHTHGSHVSLISVGDLNDYLEEAIDTMEETQATVENEVKLFQNALDFSTTHVRDCMIPRNEIVAVPFDTPRSRLSELFTSTGRSKIIVYRDDIDDIAGYIHVSELFVPGEDWQKNIKPVLYAPENLLANVMMRRLLQQKRSIAIVVDEFGGTSGFLTLEDLVEEIFGDIQDEHDKGGFTARTVEPGVYEVSGRCETAWLNENLHLDIPEDDSYQTLAGYLLCSTGTIPQSGTPIVLGGLSFEVLKKSATRLELIRIRTLEE